MTKTSLLGPWVRRFLLEYLVTERNLTRNTQRSYRDTLRLLLPFVAQQTHKQIDQILVTDVAPDTVRLFLRHLEESRECKVATRNQRLAAIRSLARFVALHSPEHIEWCGQLRNIPLKRAPRSTITYLEKSEMDALLSAPDQSTDQGRRDHALLLFLYRARELTKLHRSGSRIFCWLILLVTIRSSRFVVRETSFDFVHCGQKLWLNFHP
jgi:site-specific recombinase XerD